MKDNLHTMPWLQTNWQQLVALYENNRLPHALICVGQKGMGKFDFTLAFAKYILCLDKTNQQACGQCKSCDLFIAKNHPDFYLITAEEKQNTIKVDQIRECISKFNKTSMFNGYKVAMIYLAEQMNLSSHNALLKTLEEPPAQQALLMLVCENTHLIPATILSRCQRIDFNLCSNEETLLFLEHKIPDKDELKNLLTVTNFAPLQALQLHKEKVLQSFNEFTNDLLALLESKNSVTLASQKWQQYDLTLIIDFAIFIIRELLIHANNIESELMLTNLSIQTIQAKTHTKSHVWFKLIDELNLMKSSIQQRIAINKQFALEKLFVMWLDATKMKG